MSREHTMSEREFPQKRAMTAVETVRIFLIDDHPVVRAGIRRLLESEHGILVAGEAGSAEQGFEEIDADAVDVVLMDVKLPGIDGIEATRQLILRHPGLKVIILSAFGDEYLAQAIAYGANGYLLKTVTQKELAQAVF